MLKSKHSKFILNESFFRYEYFNNKFVFECLYTVKKFRKKGKCTNSKIAICFPFFNAKYLFWYLLGYLRWKFSAFKDCFFKDCFFRECLFWKINIWNSTIKKIYCKNYACMLSMLYWLASPLSSTLVLAIIRKISISMSISPHPMIFL